MYHYRIVVPAQLADEVENLVRTEADVSLEGLISAPEEVVAAGNMGSGETNEAHFGSPVAVLAIRSQTLETVSNLKEWLSRRFNQPDVDIRLQVRPGRSSLSVQAHTTEELKDWLEQQAA